MFQEPLQLETSTDVRKIRIPNEKLWEHSQNGCDLDQWLKTVVGMGNYTEYIGVLTTLPYRSFSFKYEEHAILFSLLWL